VGSTPPITSAQASANVAARNKSFDKISPVRSLKNWRQAKLKDSATTFTSVATYLVWLVCIYLAKCPVLTISVQSVSRLLKTWKTSERSAVVISTIPDVLKSGSRKVTMTALCARQTSWKMTSQPSPVKMRSEDDRHWRALRRLR
jgi:hypothetical protein